MGAIIRIIEQLKWSLTLLYTDSIKEVNDKDPKFKVGDHVTISKHKKNYVFVIKKVKNTVPWTYVINDLNGEEIIGTFYEKELRKNKPTKI